MILVLLLLFPPPLLLPEPTARAFVTLPGAADTGEVSDWWSDPGPLSFGSDNESEGVGHETGERIGSRNSG